MWGLFQDTKQYNGSALYGKSFIIQHPELIFHP